MQEWLIILLEVIGIFNFIPGIPLCMICCAEHGTPFLMGHKFKTIEWHGKIVIILLNIFFAPVLIILNVLYAIVNVFIDQEK